MIVCERPFEHQYPAEMIRMLERIAGMESILEIGSASGHTLVLLALSSIKGSKVCTIDAGLHWEALSVVVEKLKAAGFDANKFKGDSKSPEAISFAEEHGPFDFVFIDGDHSYEGAKADWENYGRMAKIVGFHDIAHPHHDVSKLWAEIKATHNTQEIVHSTMGIGLVYL